MPDSVQLRPKKRSVLVAGHPTSLSLEAEFWTLLGEIGKDRSMTLNQLITEIDASRGERGLSSAARVYVLNYLGEYVKRFGSEKP